MITNKKLQAYIMLMRLHRPIPILLIFWPTLTAVFMASNGMPSIKNIIIFSLGIVIMRTVGCIVNDITDKDFDKYVKRTNTRPLTTGELKVKEALFLAFILTLIAFTLVLFLNIYTILMSFIALFLAILYPFCKRFLPIPQLILGFAFNFGILMAFTAQQNTIPLEAWLFYLATICWTIAYDTIYALADKDFDKQIGLNSSVLFFGKNVILYISIFNALAIILLLIMGIYLNYNAFYFLALIISIALFIKQYFIYKKSTIENCIKAFSHNHWIGLLIFVSIFINIY